MLDVVADAGEQVAREVERVPAVALVRAMLLGWRTTVLHVALVRPGRTTSSLPAAASDTNDEGV